MPTADDLDLVQGQPLHPVFSRAFAEGLVGWGKQNSGDLEVTATATDLEIQVAAGTVRYNGSNTTLSSAETHTLSAGDGTDGRWDTVYFDAGTGSSGVREGTAGSTPVPPDIQGDELLLAVVYVASGATDVTDSEILNWLPTSPFPLPNAELANSDVTVSAGRLLAGGGSASLGNSTSVSLATDAMIGSTEGGELPDADQGIVAVDRLEDGESVEVYKAALTLSTIQAAPADLSLELVTFDNQGGYTSQATLVSGDGATIHDRVSGDPLGSYENSSGGEQSIGVIVDNQTGSSQEIFAEAIGAAPA